MNAPDETEMCIRDSSFIVVRELIGFTHSLFYRITILRKSPI